MIMLVTGVTVDDDYSNHAIHKPLINQREKSIDYKFNSYLILKYEAHESRIPPSRNRQQRKALLRFASLLSLCSNDREYILCGAIWHSAFCILL